MMVWFSCAFSSTFQDFFPDKTKGMCHHDFLSIQKQLVDDSITGGDLVLLISKPCFMEWHTTGFCQSIRLNLSENSCYHTASYCWIIPQMYVPISIHTENDLRSLQSKKTIHSSCCRPEPEHSPDSLNHCVRWNIALSMLPLFFTKGTDLLLDFCWGQPAWNQTTCIFQKKCNAVEVFCVPTLLSHWSSSIRGLHLCTYRILTWGRIPS